MKTNKLLLLCVALLCNAALRAADYVVADEDALRDAVGNNFANITMQQDIVLSATLEIPENLTVTLNMAGHTLNRNLTQRDHDHGGQVVTVRSGATLNLKNGTLTGGWGGNGGGLLNQGNAHLSDVIITGCTADDRGGGISNAAGGRLTVTGGSITGNTTKDSTMPSGGGGLFNYSGAAATLTGVTVSGNEAKVHGGGGINNFGSLTLNGCTVTGNSSRENGGGIWNGGGSTLNMQGANTVNVNTGNGATNNIFLTNGVSVTVIGSLTGSHIGINMENVAGIFTNGYSDHNSGADPATVFIADNDKYYDVTLAENEACISPGARIIVTTADELRTAVQLDGAGIVLANAIVLDDNIGTLNIESGKTLSIDLGGHTLDRGLKARDKNHGGQVITVRDGATLNLRGGTLTGGWGGNGGGLVNEGGTVTLTDVNITGNTADDRGGGISNQGTLTMTGGSITGNTSKDDKAPMGGGGLFNYSGASTTLTGVTLSGNETIASSGGGICNYGTLAMEGCTVTGNRAFLGGGGIWAAADAVQSMQGAVNVSGNTTDGNLPANVYLKNGALITVTGSLEGSSIGIGTESDSYEFTQGYPAHNPSDDPSEHFVPDLSVMTVTGGSETHEAAIVFPYTDAYYYIEHAWDGERKEVTSTVKLLTTLIADDATPTDETQYKILKSSDINHRPIGTENCTVHEYFVVNGSVSENGLYVAGPNVHIILANGSKLGLVFERSLRVITGHSLYIHDQGSGDNMGQLHADRN